ncbi:methylenetetrahydrofolate--tRNA-(uracil(54)-C(5))-methyltransferase (FADH(2)-oxidizing) TrmFO [Paracoccaceae bacterium]|nr:methylenetetrahydrofolate--tRNA-(uracil(54)-C(5))-methyltransferase (FADH(2)-oxidizing) TrmFO [Paracoccaceae bacterium]
MEKKVAIVGGGLAGSEAAWQLGQMGIPSNLYEMRPNKNTPAHKTSFLAELVCSNSFRSGDDINNAVGQLHWEMRAADGLIISMGDKSRIPAGSAMAVDRNQFSSRITEIIKKHPLISLNHKEIADLKQLKEDHVIIASGPLTSNKLAQSLIDLTGSKNLYFYDAIAPTIYADSIDYKSTWFQSRYDKGDTVEEREAYLNCPMTKDEYYDFVSKICKSDKADFNDWEKDVPFFSGCLPIEVMASRGKDTLRFGPMKPVGLTNPKNKVKPYAVVQLRKENKEGTLFNIVGFQTKIKHSRQAEILRSISGLQDARFARLGGIHKNTFLNSPDILDRHFQLKTYPKVSLAGQITGVEGYVESAAIGLLVGRMVGAKIFNKEMILPPPDTALGALANHLISQNDDFQPMNINFGLFKSSINNLKGKKNRRERYSTYTSIAKSSFQNWLKGVNFV